MLYQIGTKKELPMVVRRIPERVYTELLRGTAILDAEYGEDRNYLLTGGYSLIAETADDLCRVKAVIDYDTHICEWVTVIGKDTGYLSALFVLNDDFSIMLYLPRAIASASILNELEE